MNRIISSFVFFSFSVLILLDCNQTKTLDPNIALQSITEKDLANDINILASDEFEGRKPGTNGEDSTVAYLEKRFREIGLAPGNPNGSYIQYVPLLGVISQSVASISIGGQKFKLRTPEDFVARALMNQDHITVSESEMVFAGYGIEAPEYGWNDYGDIDVRGKTLLILRQGEPSRYTSGDTTTIDSSFFQGAELTYFSTKMYKLDLAFTKGAAAVVFILGIGDQPIYERVIPRYQSENFTIEETGQKVACIEASIKAKRLRELLAMSGYNLDTLFHRAQQPGFRAIPLLEVSISLDISLRPRVFNSRNVVARLIGSDPRLRNEYIIFSAHWDALGRDTSLKGDQIRNGAIDNAFGVAQMLEIAEAFRKLFRPPKRTIIFIGTTAEEAGFLGALFYVKNPLYPLKYTIANVNLDMSFAYGLTSDIINFSYGNSELDDILKEIAATQAHTITPDLWPAEGFYFRMDHFEFANVGVPSISTWMGINVIGKPQGFGKKKVDEYFKYNYHQPSDEVSSDWDYAGAIQHTQICFLVGLKMAEADKWPEWKPGSMFKVHRDAMLSQTVSH